MLLSSSAFTVMLNQQHIASKIKTSCVFNKIKITVLLTSVGTLLRERKFVFLYKYHAYNKKESVIGLATSCV